MAEYNKGHVDFLQRIANEGLDAEFRKVRDKLRSQFQIPLDDVWQVAGAEFPPTDGSPMEYAPTEPAQRWINHLELNRAWEPQPDPEPEDDTEESEPVDDDTEVDEDDQEQADEPKLRRSVGSFGKLRAMVGADRKSSVLEDVMWVYSNYKIDVKKIDPDGVPSIGAIGWLEHVNKLPANYAAFINGALTKLIPDKRQLEYAASIKDDGRKQLDKLADFMVAYQEEEDAA